MIPDRTIKLTLADMAGFRQEFTNLRSLYDFAIKERDVWKDHSQAVESKQRTNNPTVQAFSYFQTLVTKIEQWQESLDSWDDNQFKQQFTTLQQSVFQPLPQRWLWSGNPCVQPFIQCFLEHNPQVAVAFLNYVVNNKVSMSQNDSNAFKGAMLGYEFSNQASEITKRRNGEKTSLGHLRNAFADSKNELFTEVSELKDNFQKWEADAKADSTQIHRVNKKLNARTIRKQNKSFEENLHSWASTVSELEKTYEEKLRLKKPAEYWKSAADKYKNQGFIAAFFLIAVCLVALFFGISFFQSWLSAQELQLKLNTLQGAILFGSIAAIFTFMVKVLAKITFSSFHLMRDAEEREQLTYLYLSLTHESEIDKESRDIVLQALFSRSETGLLSQEQGPKMPMAEMMSIATKGSKNG
ncbi:hypothetical protein C4G99_RS15810 [Vibrio parahaemolyticus]|uniref:DUF6161 domain-containing protein n=1 Tax=Vibrio sp. 1262-1 TaxID=3074548 RepID=UPI00040D5EFD|nr:DUF6161 domain-containing protein [Vibrio sp. 1262-1]EJG0639400.1 hypothetical protein [Vibrio parahaemolyticus]EJG0683904.1 hypothetical protein [Vibrio parahaemolyticus]EJG0924565.1 hypothetical protein [Vibrio parahaemolyticus]EJG1043766.1 hypothetical protein [Vibrio parahaemolyticus]EJG1077195.1 hypothetical protein [Vibrio parahaemolyticus]